jgi:excisionase family DNA binding protein
MYEPQAKVFLSPAEVAAELRVSSSTVLRLIRAGKLPAIAVSERIYRIPAATLERFLDGTLRQPGGMAPIRRVSGPLPRFGEGERLPVRKVRTGEPADGVRR